jgi:adenylate cyclase
VAQRRVDTSLTAMARSTSEHNEQQVLAARALENERRVTVVRVVTLAMMVVSQGVIGNLTGDAGQPSVLRLGALAVYMLFAVGAVYSVRHSPVSVTRATWLPLLGTTFDVSFVIAMDWADRLESHVKIEQTAAMLALIISYSILRYGAASLFYGTALSIVAYAIAAAGAGTFTWPAFTFVSFAFVALALLLWSTRRAVRLAFVDLKRRDALSRLVPPKVVDEILAGREDALLRPARRDVSVLFSDVRDFTTYSESREPEDVLRFLDDYFGRMTQIVQGHDGSVNKFLGDGLLALWGAPEPMDDHPMRAVKAALDMQKVMIELNERRVADGEAPLAIGIGVHTGTVAVGMLGGVQSEYSVIGDAVNLASRIEGLTKAHGAGILVSEATWSRLGDRFAGERVGEVPVKGRKAPVVIYSITGPRPRA